MRVKYLKILLLLILSTSCSENFQEQTKGMKVENEYAEYFKIHRIPNGYILSVLDINNEATEYLLTRSKGQNNISENIIRIPVDRVICFSSTHCSFINVLGGNNTIKGISGTEFIYNPEIRERIRQKKISEVGYENKIDYEKILSLEPDVIFAYSVDNNTRASLQKFRDLDIPVVFINEYIEPKILGRTEWLKFISCFYDELELAQNYCDSVFKRYNNLKSQLIETNPDRPRVLSSMPWKGIWWVPGGNSYFAKLIEDAKGKYIFSATLNNESIPFSIEEVFSKSQNVDIWLNPNHYISKTQMLATDNRLQYFSPYNSARIYNNNRRVSPSGGNDFWESGIVHPDIILKDLIKIFHPDLGFDHDLHYYKEVR